MHGIGYSFSGTVFASEAAAPDAKPTRPAAWLVGESVRLALHAGENVLGRGDDVIEIEAPTRRDRLIATLPDLDYSSIFWGPSLSPDGKSIVYGKLVNHGEDPMMIENFR